MKHHDAIAIIIEHHFRNGPNFRIGPNAVPFSLLKCFFFHVAVFDLIGTQHVFTEQSSLFTDEFQTSYAVLTAIKGVLRGVQEFERLPSCS